MCRVYNKIGCLNTIQFELVKNDIDEFNSLNELIDFQKNYHFNKAKIIANHNVIIEEERIFIENEISELNVLISKKIIDLKKELRQKLDYLNKEIENLAETNSGIISTIKVYWINLVIYIKFWILQLILPFKIKLLKYQLKKILSNKTKRFKYISNNFQDSVNESSSTDLQKLEKKNEIIKTLNNTIYGAFGEQKVENELRKLSDDYILINDFCYNFENALNHKGDYIKSIQIDHILISPSGIFLIETKNWSSNSIDNLNLQSPVQQIYRTNFALFKILSDMTSRMSWNFTRHEWGNRKIPVKNIIVFTNIVPREQFQFIKIVGLTQLLSYVQYFGESFTKNETEIILEYLLRLSEQRAISSKLVV